jgi:NAD(P)-dependent dehydrogenase (short-subunit alcohol dehydrogenase family)
VVLVTGAAGGIGAAVARTIVGNGGSALIHDRDGAAVTALADELGSAAVPLSGDLSDPVATQRLWLDASRVHGRVDVLVNNAGLFLPLPVEASLEEWVDVWNRTLAVNLVAASILCRAAVQSYVGTPGGGIIINVASVTAFRGAAPDAWHYGASKGGVVAMTRTIARHYGRQGVTAFGVAPGFVDTPMSRSIGLDEDGLRSVADTTALGEVAQPHDVAHVIAFLATGLAKHATGTMIDVNSGSYLR